MLLLVGCTNTGNVCRFEQRSVAGISSLTLGEYTIPVVSITSGPSLNVWQSKNEPCTIELEGDACTTNSTSALGIYSSVEEKRLSFKGRFVVDTVNSNLV